VLAARGRGAAAVTPHHLATDAAMRVIDGGGNAVDGAIAANAVLGVVAPETCGVGGDLFALVHQPGMDAPATLNASGRAGSGVSSELLRRDGHRSMPSFDPATVTVPGCVDGWFALHARFGRQALRDVLSPAIELAEAGFPASKELNRALTARTSQLSRQEAGAELFVEGEPPGPGTRLSRHSLANTLRLIANGTREDFYLGGPGEDIVAATENRITAGDLGVSQADWVQPLSLDIFGLTGWTIPPNSQGYLTLAAATVYESLSPPADPESPLAWHLAIEAYRSLVGDRDELIADPDHADQPASLLDRRYLSEKAALVDPDRRSAFSSPSPGLGGTAYLCTIDAEGTGVSFIQSNFMGIGSGIGAGGGGGGGGGSSCTTVGPVSICGPAIATSWRQASGHSTLSPRPYGRRMDVWRRCLAPAVATRNRSISCRLRSGH
jgi:gamma-glutamyltranspeptidase/glutathione hydrolase